MPTAPQFSRINLAMKPLSVLAALLPRGFALKGALLAQLCLGLVAVVPVSGALLAPSEASAQAYRVKPLMIIRFNQPNVRYERPLANAIARAQAAKPDVQYTLVLFTPAYGDETTQSQLAERAETALEQVKAQMVANGAASSRIEVAHQRSTAITHTEVHILVR